MHWHLAHVQGGCCAFRSQHPADYTRQSGSRAMMRATVGGAWRAQFTIGPMKVGLTSATSLAEKSSPA